MGTKLEEEKSIGSIVKDFGNVIVSIVKENKPELWVPQSDNGIALFVVSSLEDDTYKRFENLSPNNVEAGEKIVDIINMKDILMFGFLQWLMVV